MGLKHPLNHMCTLYVPFKIRNGCAIIPDHAYNTYCCVNKQQQLNCTQQNMGGGCTRVVHGRSRMTIDPRILTNAGTEQVGFSPTRQTLVAPSAKHREVFGE